MVRQKEKINKNRIIENSCIIFFGSLLMFLFLFFMFPSRVSSIFDDNNVRSMRNDDYVKSISLICDLQKDDLDKFLCVVDFFEDVYYFNDTRFYYKSPREMFSMGGDCYDSSLFYCSVFESFDDFECVVVELDNINHVVSLVSFGNKFCLLDQTYNQCVVVKVK